MINWWKRLILVSLATVLGFVMALFYAAILAKASAGTVSWEFETRPAIVFVKGEGYWVVQRTDEKEWRCYTEPYITSQVFNFTDSFLVECAKGNIISLTDSRKINLASPLIETPPTRSPGDEAKDDWGVKFDPCEEYGCEWNDPYPNPYP